MKEDKIVEILLSKMTPVSSSSFVPLLDRGNLHLTIGDYIGTLNDGEYFILLIKNDERR